MIRRIFIAVAIFSLGLATGCQVRQSETSSAVLSDGQVGLAYGPIAFSCLTDGYWQIWAMQLDGSEPRQITTSAFDKRYPAWSQDGKNLFYRNNNNQTFRFSFETGEEKLVFEQLGFNDGAIPSPNGSKFILTRFDSQLRDSGNLWRTTLDGKDCRVLTKDAGLQYQPAWSPGGRQIVYVSSHGYRTAELYIMDSDGGNNHRLTNNKVREALPAFSPDGKTIAYASEESGDYEIWLMDIDGSNRRQLTNSKGMDTRPYWSPDGNEIVFVSSRSGSLQLWKMDRNGSNPQQLTDRMPSMDPAWNKELLH